jgi:hypothetical protein
MRGFLKQRHPDGIDHGIGFLQHLIVPKPENFEASLMQELIANTILLAVLRLAAINFDNQSHFQAHKVEYKIHEWMLAAEFETRDLSPTQALPQAIFCVSHMAAQVALQRIVDDRMVCLAFHLVILCLLFTPSPPRPSP